MSHMISVGASIALAPILAAVSSKLFDVLLVTPTTYTSSAALPIRSSSAFVSISSAHSNNQNTYSIGTTNFKTFSSAESLGS